MGWLASLLAPLLEKLLVWLFKILKRDYQAWLEKKAEEKRISEAAKRVKDSPTDEERRKNVEDMFNS